jgi:hypothetical protein
MTLTCNLRTREANAEDCEFEGSPQRDKMQRKKRERKTERETETEIDFSWA